ncbi:MAG: hypothetical protein LBL82_01165 [Oscillospiraceae bacterium]|jgi:hypothetical protein|nr:hypothetical protein [Oscillospiraceae bacterium]
MAFLSKINSNSNFAFDDILASGYSISENVPIVANEITTASGYPRRMYKANTATKININLSHLDNQTISDYLNQLDCQKGDFIFWSVKDQKYKTGQFYVDISEITVISGIETGNVTDDYSVELTQCGVISDV